MKDEVIPVELKDLFGQTSEMKSLGFRLVTLTCVDVDEDRFVILYHFDKDLTMTHFRVQVPKGQAVPSISRVYFSAFLVENEIQDHFGLQFDGLVLDYGRTLLLDEEAGPNPLSKNHIHPESSKENE